MILTSSGSDFSAGIDLNELHATGQLPAMEALAQWHRHWNEFRELLEQMLRFPKPLVAAVDGAALGSGLALVLACDLVVATPKATFGVPAIRRGLIGGTVAPLLCWRIGGAAASRLLLTGETIRAERGHTLGFVHELVPSEMVWVQSQKFCEMFAAGSAESLQLTKRLLNETIAETVLSQLTVGAGMGAAICTTDAAAEGIRAFLEQREPKWP